MLNPPTQPQKNTGSPTGILHLSHVYHRNMHLHLATVFPSWFWGRSPCRFRLPDSPRSDAMAAALQRLLLMRACVTVDWIGGCLGTGMERLELKLSTSIFWETKIISSSQDCKVYFRLLDAKWFNFLILNPKKIRKKVAKHRVFRRTGSLWICLLRSHHHHIPWWTTRRTFRSHKEVFRRVLDQGVVRWRYCRI